MADLVQANEFVFTPSAFICAFIEQESDTETTTETNVFGAVDKSIAPQDVDPVIKRSAIPMVTQVTSTLPSFPTLKAQLSGTINTDIGASLEFITGADHNTIGASDNPITFESGLQDLGNTLQITGDVTSLVGVNETSQARTDTKTITKTKGAQDTVVLVLTYGQFRSQCANPQATVDAIYNQVLSYFNSL